MLKIIFIQLLQAMTVSSSTIPPRQDFCGGSFLKDSPLVTFQFEPAPFYSDFNSISWRDYTEASLQVNLTICDYTQITGVSFETTNVEQSDIFVSGHHISSIMGQHGGIDAMFHSNLDSYRVGWKVKIKVTPKEQFLPVEIRNLKIRACEVYYDCFDSCALYILQPVTGCKQPMCRGDPCSQLRCLEDQECRLIPGEPQNTFPSVMTPGVQLWGCVDKDRRDYGCFCENYTPGENGCPTCQCGGNLTTTTTTLAPSND